MKQEIKAMWKKIKEEQGIIVLATCFFFNILRYISVFQWVRSANNRICAHRHKSPKDSFIGGYHFPEIWVLCNITCGIMVYALMVNFQLPKVLGAIFVAFAIMRAFEIMVYHVNVLLFDPLMTEARGEKYAIKSPVRMLLLLLINMAEYVLCFSIVYLFFVPEAVNFDYWQSFTLSTSAFLNIGLPENNTSPEIIVRIARIETILGVFMNLICIARFINMLPSVNSLDKEK